MIAPAFVRRLALSCIGSLLTATAALAQGPPPLAPADERQTYADVVAALGSPAPEDRVDALRALGATSYPDAIASIASLLTDPVDDIQIEAIHTLLSFYHVEKPQVVKRRGLVVETRARSAAGSIYDLGPYGLIPQPVPVELTNGLAQAMFDNNRRVRLEAVYGLGVMARAPLDQYAADALARALQDGSADVREAAARVIGGLRVTTAGNALVAVLNDKDTRVSTAAMRALGDIRAWQSLQALTDQFTFYKGRGPRAEAAFDALARIAHNSSQPLFQQHLGSGNAYLRRLAAEGLARSGNREAAQMVPTTMAGERDRAAQLARAFAGAAGGGPVGSTHVAALIDALDHGAQHEQAMGYLVELGVRAMPGIGTALGSPDVVTRERAVMVLGFIGGDEAFDLLERARADGDLRVVRAAERAIARLRKA
jgi:HEAT repeat protein